MNKAILVGNLTKDPEQRTTGSGIPVTTFTVAVTRRFKSQDGTQQADFINCVAWRATAEFIAKYFAKGSKIGIEGSIQTRTYDDANGNKRYVTEVVVDNAEFVTSKSQNPAGERAGGDYGAPPAQAASQNADDLFGEELSDFQPLDDAELPF